MRPFTLIALLCALLGFAGCGPKTPSGPLFDVPSLVHKKIGEVEKVLGAAADAPGATSDSAQKMWRKDGYCLAIEYLKRNGRITNLTLKLQ